MLYRGLIRLLNKTSKYISFNKRCYTRNVDYLQNGKTMETIKDELKEIMGVQQGYIPLPPNREALNKYLPEAQSDLPPRSIGDSFLYATIPFSTDLLLQDKYINMVGAIRMGRLMEDLDIFAVLVLQKYVWLPNVPEGQPYPYTIVTVLITSINFTGFEPKGAQDMRISGYVLNVSKTSATILVWMEQLNQGKWELISQAEFIMGARDATNSKGVPINPLVPENEREEKVSKAAAAARKALNERSRKTLMESMPSLEEQQLLHNMFLQTCSTNVMTCQLELPTGYNWMKDSTLSNTIFSFPEDRNLHNTVFGGFLLRHAVELAHALGILYTKYRPKLVATSNIVFKRPIRVGSIIKMHAHVVYTKLHFLHVVVYINSIHKQKYDTGTNIIHLTFELPEKVDPALPQTYQEAMMFIKGMRQFKEVCDNRDTKTEIIYSAN